MCARKMLHTHTHTRCLADWQPGGLYIYGSRLLSVAVVVAGEAKVVAEQAMLARPSPCSVR